MTYGEGEDTIEYKHVGWGHEMYWDLYEIDWYFEEMVPWNPAWKVKGNMNLYPIYTEVNENLDDLFADIVHSDWQFHYVKVDIEDLNDVDYDFDYEGILYVDVYDGDKLLYTWNVAGAPDGEITNFKIESSKEGDLRVKVENKLKDEDKLKENFLYLDFKSSGPTLPGTTVSYNVEGIFSNGTELEVLFVIEDGDGVKFELVGHAIVSGNTVTFDVPHYSGYVLNAIPLPSEGGTTDYLIYIAIAVVAILLIAGAAYFMHSRKN